MYHVHVSICAFMFVVFNFLCSTAPLQELRLKISPPPMISVLAEILFYFENISMLMK